MNFLEWLEENKSVTTEERMKIQTLLSQFNAGREHQKLRLDFTELDLEELQNGETFDWSFPTDMGETIDIHLFKGDVMNEEEDN